MGSVFGVGKSARASWRPRNLVLATKPRIHATCMVGFFLPAGLSTPNELFPKRDQAEFQTQMAPSNYRTSLSLPLSLSRNGALSFKVQKPARKKAAPIECIDKRASERPEIKAHSFLVSRQVASPLLLSSTGLQLEQDSDHCENQKRTCNSTTWIGTILALSKIFWR